MPWIRMKNITGKSNKKKTTIWSTKVAGRNNEKKLTNLIISLIFFGLSGCTTGSEEIPLTPTNTPL